MLRELLTIIVPLLLPTVLYLVWLRVAQWSKAGDSIAWRGLPWLWLAGGGVALMALVLYVVTVHFGTSASGIYVPPHQENGRIVPGHIEPSTKP
jgi:hypothetical protein